MTLNAIEIAEILIAHQRFLAQEPGGVRADFSNMDLFNADFRNKHLSGAIFTNAYLAGALFNNSIAAQATFTGANLTGATLTGGQFFHSNFDQAILVDAMLRNGAFDEASFIDSVWGNNDLSGATFTVSKMSFPVYGFTLLGQPCYATPTELRLGSVSRSWPEWSSALLDIEFLALGAETKDLPRHRLFINFFRETLLARGYNI